MAEDIGSIHVEADLNDIRRKEAAAIESIEGKLLGYCPKGGLGAVAMTAAARNEGVDAPMDRRGSGNATTCEVDLEEGLARRDFGNVRIEVDLNQVRQEEALALQAVESRLIGDVPPGGIGSVSTSAAHFNQMQNLGPYIPTLESYPKSQLPYRGHSTMEQMTELYSGVPETHQVPEGATNPIISAFSSAPKSTDIFSETSSYNFDRTEETEVEQIPNTQYETKIPEAKGRAGVGLGDIRYD